jgi:hypothetical protein
MLLMLYREGDLSREHRQRVEERLSTDPKFLSRLERIDREYYFEEADSGDPSSFEEADSGDPCSAEGRWAIICALTELYGQDIQVPVAGRVQRRDGIPPRYARRLSRAMPLDAGDFLRQLLDDLGLRSGIDLVDHAFRVVAATGESDHWIREVGRARDRGTINAAVACFLIREFAESAIRRLSVAHPVLSKLSAQIERIEREHDADELLAWANHAGPPEWESLCEQWDVTHDELLTLILKRNEEYEVLHALLRAEPTFLEGRRQIYGC